MDEERANAIQALHSLSLDDFITELTIRLEQTDNKTRLTNERAIDLEDVAYKLLKRKKPTDEDYKFAEIKLREIQGELRNPALYRLACDRANVAGSILVKS